MSHHSRVQFHNTPVIKSGVGLKTRKQLVLICPRRYSLTKLRLQHQFHHLAKHSESLNKVHTHKKPLCINGKKGHRKFKVLHT